MAELRESQVAECAPFYHRWTILLVGWQSRPIHVCTRCGKRAALLDKEEKR